MVFDLASRALCNQGMSMVRGKDLQVFATVKLNPLVARLFIREGVSLSIWRSLTGDESPEGDFFC